ncbi:MAG: hypothetical protein J6S82_10615 [Bacteroidales bacterium]|nr:hypothetical protein [Bacteroidales bacterium]
MAYYTPYQSQYYSQLQQNYAPPVQVQQPQNNQNGIIWIQGEQAAKSYMVAPNATVLLMDSESQRFYLKSSDASGMPLPLRIFEYTETTQNGQNKPAEEKAIDLSSYTTKAEFDAFRDEIHGILKNVPRQTRRVREVEEDE